MRGFYLGKDDQGRKYAATQFESTDARRAYPSFDEPAYKATFDITAIAPKGMVAISNTRVVSDVAGPGDDEHTVRFATSPKMSSYLAALIVGDFEDVEGEADGIPIRVWATAGKKEQGRYALKAAESILKYYDRYFQIKYPYGKLDLVALPDFSAGAMENTGCITFREVVLLLDEQHASVALKKVVAEVLAHEMAHQWFGDLVTTAWWDDIWLNEGFATWMSSKPVESFHPEWHVELDDVRDTARSLDLDSLADTRAIHQAAETPAQILELFDGIAYGKAAAVLRMVEAYMGPESFRAGVNLYLKEHAYGNATAADFWGALAQVSRKPVDKIMPAFVEQPGAPLVSVKAQCISGATRITLNQTRYFYDRSLFDAGNDQLWEIPVCLKAGGEAGAKSNEQCELLTKREVSFSLPGCASWVLANAGAAGYYRSGHQPTAMLELVPHVEDSLTPAERIMLLSDAWASVRVDREPIGDYLELAEGVKTDSNPAVMEQLLERLDEIGRNLVNDHDRSDYETWVRHLLEPALNKVGLESQPGDSDEKKTMRAELFHTLGLTGRDPQVLAEARRLTDQALENPLSVDRELAFGAFPLAALDGDSALYDKILAHMKLADPEEHLLYLRTLASFTDPALVEKTLQYALSSNVRSQDALGLVSAVMRNPADRKIAWAFVRSHWPEVEKAGGPFASSEVVAQAGSFCSPGMGDEVKEFFASHPVPAAERTLKQSLESIDYCVDLQSQQGTQLASWLGQHAGGAASGK